MNPNNSSSRKQLWEYSSEARNTRQQAPSRVSRFGSGTIVDRLNNEISSLHDELFQLDTIKGLAVSLHDKIVKRIDVITQMFRLVLYLYFKHLHLLFVYYLVLCALCFVLVIIINVHHGTKRLSSYTKCWVNILDYLRILLHQ